ncbi:hypothetical protein TNCT_137521 [Trichonephila clavata]|uniref:Uncharacterized protein n=1 Tax=Trichonephila clavata TaxID=2740835 RepID=A0A8X6KQG5_TRICU|nr:hypothetical protein TNCT_137521 [Trichonephila clavata]
MPIHLPVPNGTRRHKTRCKNKAIYLKREKFILGNPFLIDSILQLSHKLSHDKASLSERTCPVQPALLLKCRHRGRRRQHGIVKASSLEKYIMGTNDCTQRLQPKVFFDKVKFSLTGA